MQLPSAMMTESSAQSPILIFAARWSASNPTVNILTVNYGYDIISMLFANSELR